MGEATESKGKGHRPLFSLVRAIAVEDAGAHLQAKNGKAFFLLPPSDFGCTSQSAPLVRKNTNFSLSYLLPGEHGSLQKLLYVVNS